MESFRSYVRIGNKHYFLEIAAESIIAYRESWKRLELLQREYEWYEEVRNGEVYKVKYHLDEDGVISEENKIAKESIKVIVFLATYLEAYIWDLSGIVHGDSYTRKYLDKMDLISKWVIIPKLITGKEIDRSKRFFEKFKELIKLRNDFIHHKSKDATMIMRSVANMEYIEPEYKRINVEDYVIMLEELFTELNRIDPKGHHLLSLVSFLEMINK